LGIAFETYAILTVGDGLVTQIPAVIISIASALLLARGGAKGTADLALVGQLGRYPGALATVAGLMAIFAFVTGLPFIPFMLGGLILGACAAKIYRDQVNADAPIEEAPPDLKEEAQSLGDILDLDDIHVEFAPDLINMVLDPATGLDARIANMRVHVATHFGLILPDIRLTDDPSLPVGHYAVKIQGVKQAEDRLIPSRVLAIGGETDQLPDGEDVSEPVYQAPARWVSPDDQDDLALSGITTVTPTEVLATHLLEIIKSNFSRLLSLKALRRLLDEMVNLSDQKRSEANRKIIDELMPDKVSPDLLLSVLRLLLEERVSIRNLPLILEATAEARTVYPTAEAICEHVRQRLGFQMIAELRRSDGTIPLIQLAPEWEETFATYTLDAERNPGDVALPPSDFNRLATGVAEKLAKASETGLYPAIVTSVRRRRFLRTVMVAKGITNPVLSFDEIGTDARPSLVGLVAG
ncbi:MAG: FHIPEP family type III secretion protein, partial [Pseudomonadota bacterium]